MDPTLTLRRPVAVVLSRFPSVTETFILREVAEMERQGQPVRLVPLMRDEPSVVHEEARPWIGRALITPFFSIAILRSNLVAARRHPCRYFGLLLRLTLASLTSPRFLLGTWALFPKSVHLAHLLDAEGIRHVHAHFGSHPATTALVIARFSRATYSVTLHAHDLFVRRYRPYLGSKLRQAAFVRVISEYNRQAVASRYPRVQQENVHVVHVGIRTGDYGSREHQDTSSERPGAWIVCVAALRDYKGLPVLVNACARLLREGFAFRADLVGDGPMRRALQRQIAHAGLDQQVRLAGARPQHEVAALLRRRPIFVLPSVILRDGWMDGIPVALMEAMAAGAPVVASRLSGIPELVEHERTGLLVTPGDPVELAAAIRRLSHDARLRARLTDRGRQKVRAEFELAVCARRLLELVDRHNVPHRDVPAVPKALLRFPGEGADAVGVTALHTGADARVTRFVAPGKRSPSRLVVKTHTDRPGQSRPPGQRARHEFDVLTRLYRDAKAPLAVPRPVDLDEPAATVVMEECTGVALDALLREARWKGNAHERARAAMEAAGRWLSALQACTSGVAEPQEALRLWRDRVEADLARCRSVLGPTLTSRLADTAGVPAGSDGGQVVSRHGDFWPGNLLVDDGRVTVLDFEGFGPGLPCEDAAYFLAQAELFYDYPLIRRRFPALRQAFLSGFCRFDLERHPSWTAARAAAVLQILARTAAVAGPASAAGRRVRRLRRMLRKILS